MQERSEQATQLEEPVYDENVWLTVQKSLFKKNFKTGAAEH